jgi:hypothetical protein
MSERNARPASADNADWANGTYSPIDPAAQRAAGWAPNEVPDAEAFNYMFELWGDFLQWLEAETPREWSELSEAVAASSPGDRFRVINYAGYFRNRISAKFIVTGTATGGGNVNGVCTDGLRVYYFGGTSDEYLVGASPTNGAELWEVQPLATEIIALACDGGRLYVTGAAGDPGLTTLDPSDGSALDNAGTTFGHIALAAQGYYCAGISGSSGADAVDIWVSDPISLVGTGSTGSAQLRGLAVDSGLAFVGGDRNTNDVWAYRLSTANLEWQVTLDTNAFTVRAICADGNRVYVACDRDPLAAGGNANLFCLNRIDGSLLWSFDLGTGDMRHIACDDRYLYPVDDSGKVYALDLRGYGSPACVAIAGGAFANICADGVSIIGTDFGTPTDWGRYYSGQTNRTFMRVNGIDQFRRPFHALAVPID